MAWTNVGFDGSINEAQWSQMAGLLGNDYVAAASGDCIVTAVGGARSVSVAAGSLYGDGVVSTNSGAETVAMTTPVNGQWYVIALRRTWATNTSALVAIAGATTTTTTPTAPPTSFPTLNTNQGVLTDQPIAWAWCNSANTTVVVYDIRKLAVKSFPAIVASAVERDAKFMTPTQGVQVWRNDLGSVETYCGLYNSSTNPGGRDSAGWYTDTRQVGLVPIQPVSAVIATGTGSANALGVVSFLGATAVSLNGVFSANYRNYKINIIQDSQSISTSMQFRLRAAGVDASGVGTYFRAGLRSDTSGALAFAGGSGTSLVVYEASNSASNVYSATLDVFNPFLTQKTTLVSNGIGITTTNYAFYSSGVAHITSASYDGFTFFPSAGNTGTGTIQVFGYND
jgi:hypothetical protein